MAEEIELRKLRPGTVVELPPDLLVGTTAGATKETVAVYSGNETTVEKTYYPYFHIAHPTKGGEFLNFATKALDPGTKFKVASEKAAAKLTDVIKGRAKKAQLGLTHVKSIVSGCDPEMFITKADGTLIPAWEVLVCEDKADDIYSPLTDSKRFWDGFQGEWCPKAMTCLQELMENVRNGMRAMLTDARQKHPDAKLTINSTVTVPKEVLQEAKHEHVAFRCTPSFNVYQDPGEEAPDAREYPYRFAGGHLHAGIKRTTDAVIEEIVKALDAIVGVAGVSLAASLDTPLRRTMYGRAGEFRLPKHGLEYRVLSNFWLCAPPIAHLVFELFRETIRLAETGLFNLVWEADQDRVREIINSCDVKGAREMLRTNEHVIYGMLEKRFKNWTFADIATSPGHSKEGVAAFAIVTLENGVEVAIKDPTDVEKNWHLLDGQWLRMGAHGGGLWRNVK